MLKEEILFKTSKTGTTAFYFVAGVDNSIVDFLEEPAYVTFNSFGMPDKYHIYSSGNTELWSLKSSNDYYTNTLLTAVTTNFVTGYSTSDVFKKVLSTSERQAIKDRFFNNVVSTITGQTILPPTFQTYVFFEELEVDDMFANIKLTRTFDTLDTLKIYNKPINSIPQQEATTGILFGKLQAIQTLKDEVGNNIKIPLRNVPVGIFNPTEEFQAPMSLDSNGDRFFMNILESSTQNQYFNVESFTSDTKVLKTQTQFLTVPEKFKYVTTTNDNGEFVIYNAPIGSQTLVFEVDLFKQGLTKDEIILNNFPFPTNNDSNIGQFPCYYYQQIPVDIIPVWGNNQSGYTEVNVNVNLDLRKWSTYIFPPASFGNEKLETTVAKNIANTFKIQVRDMTNKKFAPKSLEIVQIPNDLDRADGSKFLWYNELLSQRQQVEFFKYGCHVIKLPANLYDPNGFKTDTDGNTTTSRGVWLASYQFNTFINIDRCKRATGGLREGESESTLNHFDLNNYSGALPGSPINSGIGHFPYEKPWSINYPEPYKITKKPIVKRFTYGFERLNQSPYILEEPPYQDGDLIGNVYDSTTDLSNEGGFGIQEFNGVIFPNQIAFVATRDYMYKYENGIAYNEQYSNGFESYWDQSNLGPYLNKSNIAGLSKVDGEKYQRLECGYGYFMKYQDWTRAFRHQRGSDLTATWDYNSVGVAGPGTYDSMVSLINYRHNMHNIDDQSMAFAFDSFLNNKINTGGIYIYRIVESGLGNINVPKNFIIPTSIILNFIGHFNRLYNFSIQNRGIIAVKMTNTLSGVLRISSTGVLINPGQSFMFEINDTISVDNPSDIIYPGIMNPNFNVLNRYLVLPGNNTYSSTDNKYIDATYFYRPIATTPYSNNNGFRGGNNSGLSITLDADITYNARSSNHINLKFVSQSDRSQDSGYDESGANLRDGVTDDGMNNPDNLIDVMLRII